MTTHDDPRENRRNRGRWSPAGAVAGAAAAALCCLGLLLVAALAAAPAAKSGARKNVDPAREVVFKVAKLECSLVPGVGCGHLLVPTMARLDRIDGVARTYSNWTGTLLRISVAPAADRETVAGRVKAQLAADEQQPARIDGGALTHVLKSEDWRDAAHIAELTSYEFRTVAKRRINAFADAEGVEKAKREKLLALVDELWDQSARGLASPKPDAGDYSAYWCERRDKFIAAYTDRARAVLTPEQMASLLREYGGRRGSSPSTSPQADDGR